MKDRQSRKPSLSQSLEGKCGKICVKIEFLGRENYKEPKCFANQQLEGYKA